MTVTSRDSRDKDRPRQPNRDSAPPYVIRGAVTVSCHTPMGSVTSRDKGRQ